jgi:hypothetical protein
LYNTDYRLPKVASENLPGCIITSVVSIIPQDDRQVATKGICSTSFTGVGPNSETATQHCLAKPMQIITFKAVTEL